MLVVPINGVVSDVLRSDAVIVEMSDRLMLCHRCGTDECEHVESALLAVSS